MYTHMHARSKSRDAIQFDPPRNVQKKRCRSSAFFTHERHDDNDARHSNSNFI
jgi:hypothetical protein